MRTLTVLEHELIPVESEDLGNTQLQIAVSSLSQSDVEQLLEINKLRRGFCQPTVGGIKLAQFCGIVRLSTCILEILPKIGFADLASIEEVETSRAAILNMLQKARKLKIRSTGTVSQTKVNAPLLEVFIAEFLQCALEQARRGLISRYITESDDLPLLRGRFLASSQVVRNPGKVHVLHCEFDEHTVDNPFNQAIRAALDCCKELLEHEPTQRLWLEASIRYSGIARKVINSSDFKKLQKERGTRRYDEVLGWAELILNLESPTLVSGNVAASGLLFDMNKLFESYALDCEELKLTGNDYLVRQGPIQALGRNGTEDVFFLKPDATVWSDGANERPPYIRRILDAKWKRLRIQDDNCGIDEADIYQLLAYAARYQCSYLELLFPSDVPGNSQSVANIRFPALAESGAHISLIVTTLPLWS